MKRFLSMAAIAAVAFGFCGCGTTIVNNVAPGVDNEVKVASAQSRTAGQPDFNKTCVVVVDGTGTTGNYNNEVRAYTENALRYIGYTVVPESEEAQVTVTCKYHITSRRRMMTFYELTAMEGKEFSWWVETSCSSSIRDFRPFLPGLAASAIPYIGKQQVRAVISPGKYPQYLTAVMGTPPAHGATETTQP